MTVGDGRQLSFAEYGPPDGLPIVWLHGTPDASRQIPLEARAFAAEMGVRIIGIDRPGIGSSSPYLHDNVLEWTNDLRLLLDALSVDTFRLVGLSGGGPYVLAAGAAMPERVLAVAVLGGVAPTRGPDAAPGGLMRLAVALAPALRPMRLPLGFVMTQGIRDVRPFAGPVLDLYAAVQPTGDRTLLARPEFKAMFIDDLLHGSRTQMSAALTDLVLFTRDWGFELSDVRVPVRWWHGDVDHIVPFSHGRHCVDRLPDASLTVIDGESHLGGLGIACDVLASILAIGADLEPPGDTSTG